MLYGNRYIFHSSSLFFNVGISIPFPELSGCLICDDNEEEAFTMGRESLWLRLYGRTGL